MITFLGILGTAILAVGSVAMVVWGYVIFVQKKARSAAKKRVAIVKDVVIYDQRDVVLVLRCGIKTIQFFLPYQHKDTSSVKFFIPGDRVRVRFTGEILWPLSKYQPSSYLRFQKIMVPAARAHA